MSKTRKNVCVSAGIILINFILFLTKLYAGLYTGSICIYTDAVNNLMDCLTCIIAVIGFFILSKTKNEKYPFGYGRVQDFVSLIMSAVVIVAGFSFAYSAIERLLYPMPVAFTGSYAILLSATAFVKLGIAFFLHRFIKKNPSPILADMRLDSILDFFITTGTVISFTVAEYLGFALDGLMGVIVSVVIIISGVKILIPSFKVFLGRREDELCDCAAEFISSSGCNVRDVQCHSYGTEKVFTACVYNCNDIGFVINEFRKKFGYELYITFEEKTDDKGKEENSVS